MSFSWKWRFRTTVATVKVISQQGKIHKKTCASCSSLPNSFLMYERWHGKFYFLCGFLSLKHQERPSLFFPVLLEGTAQTIHFTLPVLQQATALSPSLRFFLDKTKYFMPSLHHCQLWEAVHLVFQYKPCTQLWPLGPHQHPLAAVTRVGSSPGWMQAEPIWGLGTAVVSGTGCYRELISRYGSTKGWWMALGNDLTFNWSNNGDSCDLPWFVAVNWMPGAPHTLFRCWGSMWGHQQAVTMNAVQSTGWCGAAGPTLDLVPPAPYTLPTQPHRPWPSNLAQYKLVIPNFCLTGSKGKYLNSLHQHTLTPVDFFQAVFK